MISCGAIVLLVALALMVFTGCSKSKALNDAIQKGDTEKVKVLLESHPDLVSSTNKDGWTPLETVLKFKNDMVLLGL